MAYLNEDFQATPLKKYIAKEEYERRKLKEKQHKQLKRERKELQRMEELKKQDSVWSILDDSFYNKIEPCGNKNASDGNPGKLGPYFNYYANRKRDKLL